MAYLNVSHEGNKPIGPIGLKKAEKDLIMRRYKAQQHLGYKQDSANRLAVVYGNQAPTYNSQDRGQAGHYTLKNKAVGGYDMNGRYIPPQLRQVDEMPMRNGSYGAQIRRDAL